MHNPRHLITNSATSIIHKGNRYMLLLLQAIKNSLSKTLLTICLLGNTQATQAIPTAAAKSFACAVTLGVLAGTIGGASTELIIAHGGNIVEKWGNYLYKKGIIDHRYQEYPLIVGGFTSIVSAIFTMDVLHRYYMNQKFPGYSR